MGERKGQNFYYPPDFDPKKHGNLNAYHGVHALRERANKIGEGIIVIRFEMPYNIWCGSNVEDKDPDVKGCRKHIGIGVRYNAEKTRVGMYYTTPVYQFKMRCHICSNPIVIRTDPGNMDYICVSGARRVEQRWDPTGNGQIVPEDNKVGRKLADDAMYKLEHESGDKGTAESEAAPRIARMYNIADRVKDDYMANRLLRDRFREQKKEREEAAGLASRLRAKAGVDIDIVAERETDIKMARLLSLQAHTDAEDIQTTTRDSIEDRDIFATAARPVGSKKELALHTLQKAAGSKHKLMVKSKGFGVLVKKREMLEQCRLVSSPSLVTPSSVATSSVPPSSVPPSSVPSSSVQPSSVATSSVTPSVAPSSSTGNVSGNGLSSLLGSYGSSGEESG